MSKLSLSRSKAPPQAQGPLTSTQLPPEAIRPTEALSREELYFQRQLEAALRKSKAEFEKTSGTDEPCGKTVSQSGSEGDVHAKKPEARPKKLPDSSDDEVEEIDCAKEDDDDEDFRPLASVKGSAVKVTSSTKRREPSTKCDKIEKNPSPVKTSRMRTVTRPSKYKVSDSEDDESEESSNIESEEESSEDEIVSKSKKRVREPAKKSPGPPPKKPQPKTSSKSEKKTNQVKADNGKTDPKPEPIKITLRIPKPAETKPEPSIPKAEKNENAAPAKKILTAQPKPASKNSTAFTPVITPKSPSGSLLSASSRPNRVLIPKWNPPAMVKNNGSNSSSSHTPSPVIGLRVGLSRNFKPATPLHKSFKNIE